MTTVMADDKQMELVLVHNSKQHRIWKPAHKTAADVVFDDWELKWVGAKSLNNRIDFGAKLVAEARTLSIVVGYGSVEIGYAERVILDNHSEDPPVRRKNSA
jgi:hypothetical protein